MADPGVTYLGAAFGIAWLAMAAYFVRLARAQRDIDKKLSDTRSEATDTTPPPTPPAEGTQDVR